MAKLKRILSNKYSILIYDAVFFYFFILPSIRHDIFVFFGFFMFPAALVILVYFVSNKIRWRGTQTFKKAVFLSRSFSALLLVIIVLLVGELPSYEAIVVLLEDAELGGFVFLYLATISAVGVVYSLILLEDVIKLFEEPRK